MGLNESYARAKSQVLMQIPVPNVNQAYTMIINVESQRVMVLVVVPLLQNLSQKLLLLVT